MIATRIGRPAWLATLRSAASRSCSRTGIPASAGRNRAWLASTSLAGSPSAREGLGHTDVDEARARGWLGELGRDAGAPVVLLGADRFLVNPTIAEFARDAGYVRSVRARRRCASGCAWRSTGGL